MYEREDWDMKNADVRTTLSIDTDKTVYMSYIDFDKLVWVAQFWQNEKLLTETTWQFHNSQYDWNRRHADEKKEHDDTVRDLWTKVDILDTSDNSSKNVREY